MAQQSSSNMKVIVLAVISIILLASTVGALALYFPTQSQLTEKDNTITSLQSDISSLQDQLDAANAYKSQVTTLQTQNQNLQDEWDELNATVYEYSSELSDMEAITQLTTYGTMYSNASFDLAANSTKILYSNTVNYAGYVVVDATSNVTSTYATVSYSYTYGGTDYDFAYNQTLGKDNTVIFAILPGIVTVTIGCENEADSVVAVVYYYY
jgi:hypothetical protein